jgi:hypothetical protein
MGALTIQAVDDARAVGTAAQAMLYAIRSGTGDLDAAVDWLEVNAVRIVGDPVNRFDAPGEPPSEEDLLALAASQLGIGTTLVAAEAAAESTRHADRLDVAITALEGTADSLEMDNAGPAVKQGFDTAPHGTPLDVRAAAYAALDEMAGGAAEVATAVLDNTLKPVVERIPGPVRDLVDGLHLDVGGRLVRWGLRAVRRGLDLLQRLVDIDAIERVRARIDSVLERLGRNEDAGVLAGWAIGADAVRDEVARRNKPAERAELVAELADLTTRFVRLCGALRGVAIALAGLASVLALLQITLPHAGAITIAGLVLIIGATVVLGRDYTGSDDLPGRVRGVGILLRTVPDASGA